MWWLVASFFSLLPLQQIADLEVTPVSFDGGAFREAFNSASDRPRLVLVSSPTCPGCVQKVADVQEILSRYRESRMQVFVLWAPYMQTDNRPQAQRASLYMNDWRARHFWDLWRFGTRSYSEQLNIPPRFAWDLVLFYKPHLVWEGRPPEATFWMHALPDYGTLYSKTALEAALRPWVEP